MEIFLYKKSYSFKQFSRPCFCEKGEGLFCLEIRSGVPQKNKEKEKKLFPFDFLIIFPANKHLFKVEIKTLDYCYMCPKSIKKNTKWNFSWHFSIIFIANFEHIQAQI